MQQDPKQKQIGPRGRMSAVHRHADNQESEADKYLQDVLLDFDRRICGEAGEQSEDGPAIQIEVNID